MDVMRWIGVTLLSSIMGFVLGILSQAAVPDLPVLLRVALELIGTALILRALLELARIAATMEVHHGKQFD